MGSSQSSHSFVYIVHSLHPHDRLYCENLTEFLATAGISTTSVLLDNFSDGQRPQLRECLSGDALGVIGLDSQLDHSYIGDAPFLKIAAECRIPVIQWILDHPSSRLPDFSNSSAENSRFLFSSRSAEEYFNSFGIRNALTATVACVGPSHFSRVNNFDLHTFSNRPIIGMVAINLRRIGGTLDDVLEKIGKLEIGHRHLVEKTIEDSYFDMIQPLETHFENALSGSGLTIAVSLRHTCMQMVEEIVQIRRRQKILEVARDFPVLIQSDAASRRYQPGAVASFKENQDVAVTWARLRQTRAHLCISNMHDMVQDRVLNGLNAGCVNIVEDSYANRRVFTHGRDALFFRYDDDSLRECLELVCSDVGRSYDIAAAGFSRRDEPPFRFGNFDNILRLLSQPFPSKVDG